MENLIVKKTKETPAIIFKPEKGVFQIVGNSWPENAESFYKKIFKWLEDYFIDPLEQTVFEFRLNYFNTASAKQIVKLLVFLKEKSQFHNVKIIWFYKSDDYGNYTEAKRYQTLLNIDNIMEIKELKTSNSTE